MKTNLSFIILDVSMMAPPEPMTAILTHLSTLTTYECLLIKHRRQPFPLYEKLKEVGFSYYCFEHAQNDISLFIFHQSVQAMFDQIPENILMSKGKNR